MNAPVDGWAIVDRRRERGAIDDALRDPGSVVLLLGEVGVGTSTLARAVATSWRQQTTIIALPELAEVPLAALAAVIPGLGRAVVDDRFGLAVEALSADADDRLVVVEDASQLDALSAAVIHQVVRVARVRAILAAHPGESLPAPLERLRQEGAATVVGVAPFDVQGVEDLIRAAMGVAPDPGTLAALYRTSGGNPLFVRTLVENASALGAVRLGAAGVSIDADAVPHSLVELVAASLDRLDASSLSMLTRLVHAAPIPLERVDDPDILALLVRQRLLRVDGDVVRVAHPMLREALLARIPPSRHRLHIQEAASLLMPDGDDQERIRRVTLHVEADLALDAGELADGAELANALQDHRLAARLGALAAERGDARGVLARAVALSGLGEDDAAEQAFDEARTLARDPVAVMRTASRAAHHAALRRGDPGRAIALTEIALTHLQPGSPEAGVLEAEIVKWRAMAGGSLELAQRSADDGASAPPLAQLMITAMVHTMAGRLEEARSAIDSARPRAREVRVDEPFADVLLDLDEYLVLVFGGELAAAQAFAASRADPASPHTLGLWSFVLALQHQQLGRLSLARDAAERAVRSLRWFDFTGLVGPAQALLATVCARMGEVARAESILAAIDPAFFADVKVVLQAAEARSWLLFARGRSEVAARTVADAAVLGVERGHPALAALTAFVAVVQGSSGHVTDVLERVASASDAGLLDLHARHARAASDRDAPALDLIALAYQAVAHPLGAALAATTAAREWERVGRVEAARTSRRRLSVLGPIEGLPGDSARADNLTPRELEVAIAAAERELSREIADRLGVSVRTVDHQLGSVYRKLGVSSRRDLRAALAQTGLLPDVSAPASGGASGG